MKLVRGFGPGHPQCRSNPHSHRPPPPGSPRNAPARSILLTRHRCTRSVRYRSTRETDGRIDGRAVDRLIRGRVRPALGNYPFTLSPPPSIYLLLGEIPILRYVGSIVPYTCVSVYKRDSPLGSKSIFAINKSRVSKRRSSWCSFSKKPKVETTQRTTFSE